MVPSASGEWIGERGVRCNSGLVYVTVEHPTSDTPLQTATGRGRKDVAMVTTRIQQSCYVDIVLEDRYLDQDTTNPRLQDHKFCWWTSLQEAKIFRSIARKFSIHPVSPDFVPQWSISIVRYNSRIRYVKFR